MRRNCRSILTFQKVFGEEASADSESLPWLELCDAVFCMSTKKHLSKRGAHLKKSLKEAGLSSCVQIIVNEGAYTKTCRKCSPVRACGQSHAFAIDYARRLGMRIVLVLEDDFYFDVPVLKASFDAMRGFLKQGVPFSAFLLGGVYLKMRPTGLSRVFKGRGAQTHAWILDSSHPVWSDEKTFSRFDMVDIYNNVHGETYMLYPDVAFQRNFQSSEDSHIRPVYPLQQFPLLYRILTWIGLKFGMRNCWEGCARNTNYLIRHTGSLEMLLGGLVSCLTVLLLLLFQSFKAFSKK